MQDLVGKYFEALYHTGDTREFYYIVKNQTHRCPHDEGDGQEWMKRVLQEEHLAYIAPTNPPREKPGILLQVKSLLSWFIIPLKKASWPPRKSRWEKQKSSNFTLPVKELREKLAQKSIPLNSFLIHTLNQSLLPHYQETKNSWWLVPVALPDELRKGKGNNISFMDLYLKSVDGTEEITRQLRENLKSGNYWGHVLGFLPLKFVSPKLLALVLPFFFHSYQRTISFSHLGAWNIDSIAPGDITIIPPVFSLSPLFVVIFEYNGVMNLSFSIQPHLELPLENIMADWEQRIKNGP